MTPEQKLKYLIIKYACEDAKIDPPPYPCDNIDTLWEDEEELGISCDKLYEATNECRDLGIATQDVPCQCSRHYESEAHVAEMPDGSWVGWTYWYGGGKHGCPEEIDWIGGAFDVKCVGEEIVLVKKFAKV